MFEAAGGENASAGRTLDLAGSCRGGETGAGGNTLSGSASDRYLIPLWEDLCENETETFQ